MRFSIDKIIHKDDFGNDFEIDLEGKNLIITGNNGSGKTNFLRQLHSRLEQKLISTGDSGIEHAINKLQEAELQLKSRMPGDSLYDYYNNQKDDAQRKIDSEKRFSLSFNDER
ncbi:TPA: AAA family ATPase, partial [Enterobacter roggenkampii]|nr:AAA family ATPase [Enterobacter roggenkampii]